MTTTDQRQGAGHIYGGHIADLGPGPQGRMYPQMGPRPVEMSVMQFAMYPHYHVRLQEEENPIWDSREGVWRVCWDDTESKGRLFTESFRSWGAMRHWVWRMMQTTFPKTTHTIKEDYTCKLSYWKNEGD